MEPSGRIYKEKRMGAKRDPWGTPQINTALLEVSSPILTEKVILAR